MYIIQIRGYNPFTKEGCQDKHNYFLLSPGGSGVRSLVRKDTQLDRCHRSNGRSYLSSLGERHCWFWIRNLLYAFSHNSIVSLISYARIRCGRYQIIFRYCNMGGHTKKLLCNLLFLISRSNLWSGKADLSQKSDFKSVTVCTVRRPHTVYRRHRAISDKAYMGQA